MARDGRSASVSVTLATRALRPVERAVGKQVGKLAAEHGEALGRGPLHVLNRRQPAGVDVHQQRPLGVPRLGEGVGQRGAGVVDVVREALPAVQVP